MKSAFVATLLATASLGAAPAFADTPLPGPTVSGLVNACTTTPCLNDFSQGAGASTVPLSQFGDNYSVTNINLSHNPTEYVTTQSTPGKLVVGDPSSSQYSVITANGSPKVTAAASVITGVGGTITSATLTYFFEIIPDLGQGALTPVTADLNAVGQLSGSTTSAPSSFASINAANVTAEIDIAHAFEEIAEAQYDYVCVLSDNDCSQTTDSSTSNVTVNLGTTSTFSGGFDLKNMPLALVTDHPYQLDMNASISMGDFPGVATASVDPMITVPLGYSLLLSPGISAGGVPEPATWATILVGLGMVGGLARRRRALPVA
jgi:hypothetical protein